MGIVLKGHLTQNMIMAQFEDMISMAPICKAAQDDHTSITKTDNARGLENLRTRV